MRKRKKREKDLKKVCDDIITECKGNWEDRHEAEVEKRKEINEKEASEWEKFVRLNKAKKKKEDLLKKIKSEKGLSSLKRDEKWISEKKKCWRKFRDKCEINDLEEQEIIREKLKRIPVRQKRSEVIPTIDFSKSIDLKKWAKFNSDNVIDLATNEPSNPTIEANKIYLSDNKSSRTEDINNALQSLAIDLSALSSAIESTYHKTAKL